MAPPDLGELHGVSGMRPPDLGELHGISGMAPPDLGELHGISGMAPPPSGLGEQRGVSHTAGGRTLHTQVSLLPMDMRDVHHTRLLEEIRTGRSTAPGLHHLPTRDDTTVVRTGSDVFPAWSATFFELAFPLLFPFGTCGPAFKRHHPLSLERYMRLALNDASDVFAQARIF